MPSIFDLLEKDHHAVHELLEKLQSTPESAEKTRQELFSQIKQELEIHAQFEEQVVYPATRKATGLDDEVEDSFEEHAEVKSLLEELSSLDVTSSEWMDAIEELSDAVEHHVEDEETKLFPEARKKIGEDQAAEMGRQYQEMKQKQAA